MAFQLGYSTYALHMVDPFEAVRRVRDTGYDALEIAVGDEWPTAPHKFGPEPQRKLSELSKSLGFPSPALFGAIDVCSPPEERDAMMSRTLAKFEMAKTLHYDDSPILITTTAGRHRPGWDEGKAEMRDAFLRLGDFAAQHGITIAIEAHAGTDFELPEKAVWMMDQTKHPNLKLDLDISHFVVEGAEMVHSVDICAPHSVMVHVKEGRKVNGEVQFRLTGENMLDLPGFLRTLRRNGLEHLPVYAEVSVQQSRQPFYGPWETARFCFDALNRARREVGPS